MKRPEDAYAKTIPKADAIPPLFTRPKITGAAVFQAIVTRAVSATGRLSRAKNPDQVKALLIPGRVLRTETGCFLILAVLGQGATGIVLLVLPLNIVARMGAEIDLDIFGSPDVYDFIENDREALNEWAGLELPKRVIKILIAPLNTDQGRRADEALRNEAVCLASLVTPVTPFFIDTGIAPLPWILSEFILGVVLGNAIRERYRDGQYIPFSWSQIYRINRGGAIALLDLHKQNVLHLDVKPDNIFFQLGEHGKDLVRLIDLGLGMRHLPEGLEHLLENVVPGGNIPIGAPADCTPEYAPPEQQIAGYQIGAKADVYALTGTLCACLTGHSFFQFKPERQTREALMAAWIRLYQEKMTVAEHGVPYLTHPGLGGSGAPTPPQRTLYNLIKGGFDPDPINRLDLAAWIALFDEVEHQRVALTRPQRRASDRMVRNGAVTLPPQPAITTSDIESRLEQDRAMRRDEIRKWRRLTIKWIGIILALFALYAVFQALSPIILEKFRSLSLS